jgi:hypothetical protein
MAHQPSKSGCRCLLVCLPLQTALFLRIRFELDVFGQTGFNDRLSRPNVDQFIFNLSQVGLNLVLEAFELLDSAVNSPEALFELRLAAWRSAGVLLKSISFNSFVLWRIVDRRDISWLYLVFVLPLVLKPLRCLVLELEHAVDVFGRQYNIGFVLVDVEEVWLQRLHK